MRDKLRAKSEGGACDGAGRHGKRKELPYRGFCFVDLVGTEMLTENDRDRASHREANDVKEVEDRRGNVGGGYAFNSALGIALQKDRLTEGPKELVDEQGRALDEHIAAEGSGDLRGFVKTDEGGILALPCVSDDYEYCRLDIS